MDESALRTLLYRNEIEETALRTGTADDRRGSSGWGAHYTFEANGGQSSEADLQYA